MLTILSIPGSKNSLILIFVKIFTLETGFCLTEKISCFLLPHEGNVYFVPTVYLAHIKWGLFLQESIAIGYISGSSQNYEHVVYSFSF